MEYIDLHVHSNCSDGTLSPAELAAYAAEKGLAAFALTDHDTAEGISEAAKAAALNQIELIPGIEFSTEYEGREVHILGLDIRPEQEDFARHLDFFQKSRENRNEEMARLLRQKAGFDIYLEEIQEANKDSLITRAHFGRWLVDKGYVSSIKEVFARYIGDGCPCFVPKQYTEPKNAIRLIRNAGGTAVLAHPLLYRFSGEKLAACVADLKEAGLQGLEAVYSANTGADESRMRSLARKLNLKISGGSDFHGKNKPLIDLGTGKGNLRIPYEILENLRA